jgi:hypothetical protein
MAGTTTNELPKDVKTVLATLPRRSFEDVARQPGLALIDVLELIDKRATLFRWKN